MSVYSQKNDYKWNLTQLLFSIFTLILVISVEFFLFASSFRVSLDPLKNHPYDDLEIVAFLMIPIIIVVLLITGILLFSQLFDRFSMKAKKKIIFVLFIFISGMIVWIALGNLQVGAIILLLSSVVGFSNCKYMSISDMKKQTVR